MPPFLSMATYGKEVVEGYKYFRNKIGEVESLSGKKSPVYIYLTRIDLSVTLNKGDKVVFKDSVSNITPYFGIFASVTETGTSRTEVSNDYFESLSTTNRINVKWNNQKYIYDYGTPSYSEDFKASGIGGLCIVYFKDASNTYYSRAQGIISKLSDTTPIATSLTLDGEISGKKQTREFVIGVTGSFIFGEENKEGIQSPINLFNYYMLTATDVKGILGSKGSTNTGYYTKCLTSSTDSSNKHFITESYFVGNLIADVALQVSTNSGVYNDLINRGNALKGIEGENAFEEVTEKPDPDNPYNPGGQSGTGGGTGDFDGSSDDIPIPDLPTISAVDTGFVGLFSPSLTQLKALSDYMWSDLFSVETFKKIFADPMDCILGLSIVPVSVPAGGTGEVKVGNISTGVSMTKAGSEFVAVDCGTLNINEFWGSFLDYAPHTKISIYLPYVGFRPLNTDEIMGKSLQVVYHVDILTGALIAYLKAGNSVISTFEGACASNIPLSATDWTSTINGILSIAESAVSAAATGGIAGISKAAGQMALSGAQNISSLKPTIEHSGSVSGAGAIMAIQKPYILASRPNQCLPYRQNEFSGYPSFITAQIGSQSGFTTISEINPTGISATEEEEDEIISLLKSGVFV